ncbi:PspA/IM30 family protein [Paenibacillus sp. P26]|nr:PspA/IM30 family protein [Paenibacillus sp. P26]
MGIFKRVKDIALADIHHLLDQVEDPIRMVKQYIREVEEKLDEGREALAKQLLTERKYEALMADAEEMVLKRTRQANLAIDREEEGIAQLAVEEKLLWERKLQEYRDQADAVKNRTIALEGQLRKLKETYDELLNKKRFLESRVSAAQAIQELSEASFSFDSEKVNRGVARMEEQVWRQEARGGGKPARERHSRRYISGRPERSVQGGCTGRAGENEGGEKERLIVAGSVGRRMPFEIRQNRKGALYAPCGFSVASTLAMTSV